MYHHQALSLRRAAAVCLRGPFSLSARKTFAGVACLGVRLGACVRSLSDNVAQANGVHVLSEKQKTLSMYPAHASMYFADGKGSKILHLVRHAEGIHNAAARDEKEKFWGYLYNSKEMWDAPLTDEGKRQCAALKAQILEDGVDVDLVVVSPLTRTLQTADLSFGQTHPKAPFIANELCRERIAQYTSEGRKELSEIKRVWPSVDFSLVTDETDQMFAIKEKDEDVQRRAMRFLNWLMLRKESRIAVVTHSVFLQQLYMNFTNTLPQDYYDKRQDFAGMRTTMICYAQD